MVTDFMSDCLTESEAETILSVFDCNRNSAIVLRILIARPWSSRLPHGVAQNRTHQKRIYGGIRNAKFVNEIVELRIAVNNLMPWWNNEPLNATHAHVYSGVDVAHG